MKHLLHKGLRNRDVYDWDKHTVSEYDGAANVNGGDYYTASYSPDDQNPMEGIKEAAVIENTRRKI